MINAVSTSTLFAIPQNAAVSLESQLGDAETELSTGLLANPVESLGSDFGLDLSLHNQIDTLSTFSDTNAVVQNTLTTAQNAITSMTSDVQSFVSALISATNTNDPGTLVNQAQNYLSSLINTANTATGGAYVFAGANNSQPPYNDYYSSTGTPSNAQAATATALNTELSQTGTSISNISPTQMQTFLSGNFSQLFTGANWTTNWYSGSAAPTTAYIAPGQSVVTSFAANQTPFQDLANAYVSIADLGAANMSSSTQQTVIQNALNEANAGLQGLNGMASAIGLSQSQLTTANSNLQTQSASTTDYLNQLEGVDPSQAATQLAQLQTQLETAYQLTDRISKLGLVNYLA
jgi:flagellar hook-associated protein 3 FlgL